MHLFPDEMASSSSVETTTSPLDTAYDPSKFFHALDPNNHLRSSSSSSSDSSVHNNNNVNSSLKEVSATNLPRTLKLVKVYEAPFFTGKFHSVLKFTVVRIPNLL